MLPALLGGGVRKKHSFFIYSKKLCTNKPNMKKFHKGIEIFLFMWYNTYRNRVEVREWVKKAHSLFYKKCFLNLIQRKDESQMEKQKKNIAGTVRDLVAPVADEFGFMLWDVEYVKEGADMILRITIDKPEGIDIEDCEKMARAIDPIIDEADPIEVSYKMEVSSPGIERALTRPEHFEACMGEKIEVKLYAPMDGKKQIVGILTAADEKSITVTVDEADIVLEKSAVPKVSTAFDW